MIMVHRLQMIFFSTRWREWSMAAALDTRKQDLHRAGKELNPAPSEPRTRYAVPATATDLNCKEEFGDKENLKRKNTKPERKKENVNFSHCRWSRLQY